VALEYDVPFVDMQSMSENLVAGMGVEASKSLYMWIEPGEYARFPDGKEDNTHFREKGAKAMAQTFVESIEKLGLEELSQHITLTD